MSSIHQHTHLGVPSGVRPGVQHRLEFLVDGISLHQTIVVIERLLIAAFFMLVLGLSSAGAQSQTEQSPRLVSPDEMTSGSLLLQATEDGRFLEAPRIATDVEISVSGPFARTRVTQRFENPSEAWVEGVYVFPLPDASAVDTLKMQIGERYIEGKIEERQKAKAIYEAAKRAGKKASLLEQERPNIFTNSVANIGPGETIVVQIEYQETIALSDGEFSLRFPMVVAPRFNPAPTIVQNVSFENETGWGAVNDPVPDHTRITPPVLDPDLGAINPVSLSVDVDAGFPLGAITSSYHKVDIDRRGAERVKLTLSEKTVSADRDFELRWSPKSGSSPSAALFTETINGEPHYLLMITPPAGIDAVIDAPREVIFVIDTSGSMGGQSIRQAKQSLEMALKRLDPKDSFNVIQFNTTMDMLFLTPRKADETAISRALNYVSRLNADGGTNMLPALRAALIDQGSARGALRQVIFLTDGAIGNEQQLFETIAGHRGKSRIFTVGIGSAPNSFFMSRAAELGQGAFTHIGDVSEVAERMSALFAKLEAPAITDLEMKWPDGAAVEMWPSPIPDAYKGESVVIAAKTPSKKGIVSLSGRRGDESWQVNLPLNKARARAGVSKLWARKKIAALELDRAKPGAEREGLDASILGVALDHSLISRLTSLVAVDVTPSRPQGEEVSTLEAPTNLPHGWEFDKVFGEHAKPLQRDAALHAPAPAMLKTRLATLDAAAAPAGQGGKSVALPQGASLFEAMIIRGLLFLFAALALLILIDPRAAYFAQRLINARRRS